MATQKDVAWRAGVSFITVSRVVNGLGNVKEATRIKVEEAIRELKYYPNALGKALNQGKTGTIGLVTPIRMQSHLGIDNYLIGLMDGIERRCSETRIDLLLSIETHPERGEDPLRLVHQKKVDGIIFVGFQRIAPEVLEEITSNQIPCVVIADRPGASTIPWIDGDNMAAGREAVSKLLGAGARQIGFVVNDPQLVDNLNVAQRWEGGRRELEDRGVDRCWTHLVADLGRPSGTEAFGAWEALGAHRPDGLVFGNDELALGFVEEALSRGIRVPGEVRVVGFDALPDGQRHQPPLSTFRQPLVEMGYAAARLLEKQVNGQLDELAPEDREELFQLEFVAGGTLG